MRKQQVDQQYWHAVLNDEIGGWAVTNYDTDATSKLNPGLGQVVVADCLNERLARHIVALHNQVIDGRVEDALRSFFDLIEIHVVKGDQKWAARATVTKGSPIVAYEHAIEGLSVQTIGKLREQSND